MHKDGFNEEKIEKNSKELPIFEFWLKRRK